MTITDIKNLIGIETLYFRQANNQGLVFEDNSTVVFINNETTKTVSENKNINDLYISIKEN